MDTCEWLINEIMLNQGGINCQINNEVGYLSFILEKTGPQQRVKFSHPGITDNGPFALTDPIPDELALVVNT